MSEDMRQGVTPAGHVVLDMVEAMRGDADASVQRMIMRACESAAYALADRDPLTRKVDATCAAALLIRAIEQIDKELES